MVTDLNSHLSRSRSRASSGLVLLALLLAGSTAPAFAADPDLVRVPPPSNHTPRSGAAGLSERGQSGAVHKRLVAGLDGHCPGAGCRWFDLRYGSQVPSPEFDGAGSRGRPREPLGQTVDRSGPRRRANSCWSAPAARERQHFWANSMMTTRAKKQPAAPAAVGWARDGLHDTSAGGGTRHGLDVRLGDEE